MSECKEHSLKELKPLHGVVVLWCQKCGTLKYEKRFSTRGVHVVGEPIPEKWETPEYTRVSTPADEGPQATTDGGTGDA